MNEIFAMGSPARMVMTSLEVFLIWMLRSVVLLKVSGLTEDVVFGDNVVKGGMMEIVDGRRRCNPEGMDLAV